MCESKCVCDCVEEKRTTAKERVQQELEELKDKIVKLSAFLYSEKAIAKDISWEMRNAMRDQLRHMEDYAICLQHRLDIWGCSDEELHQDDKCCRPLAY